MIGGGAAGIIAAWRAATLGAKVVVLEKTIRIGTKILISGGGKCNITHDGPLEQVLRAFRTHEAKFIRPACYRFPNQEIVKLLTDKGLVVYTRPDGRIFPVDQTAKDVVRILLSYLEDAGVNVRYEHSVKGIGVRDGKVTGVQIDTPKGALGLETQCVIVCAGGSSYPNSGTTGDGWQWARTLGHTIVKPRAALAPIYLQSSPEDLAARSGIALRACMLKARLNGKEVARWTGDLLFTHHGISGPCALGISRVVTESLLEGPITLEVDVVPSISFEQVSSDLLAQVTTHPKRLASTYMEAYVPKNLVNDLLTSAAVSPEVPGYRLDKKSRNRLVTAIKGWPIGPVRTVPLEKGEVVAGGISLEEVDPHTMQSKLVSGLYACGEVLDIAGPVGGYNLQAAFATGFVAGESAAKQLSKKVEI